MRQPRKSNPSSMWQTLVFSSDRRRPIGASTAPTSVPERFGVGAVPATMTTKSSA